MNSKLRIEILNDNNSIKYEEFLLSFDESLIYYTTKYQKFLEHLLECKSKYLIVINENSIQAVLPVFIKNGKFGQVMNTLPYYGSNGGILAKTTESYNLLLEYYFQLAENTASSTYISNPLSNNTINLKGDIIENKLSQWTSLNYTQDIERNIMDSFHPSARRNIRKALKSNIKITIDNNQIEFLYKTHYDNITELKGKVKDKNFFYSLDNYFEKGIDYNIYIATLDGKKIGALLLFYFNHTIEYFTPAVIKEFRNLQALPLIIYNAMIAASKQQYKWWNWGGTWPSQYGVYKFKAKFGAVDKEYKYFIKINNTEIYKSTQNELLKEYDNFYTIPFNMLNGDK